MAKANPNIAANRPTSQKTARSEEHTSELQSRLQLVCRLLLEKKHKTSKCHPSRTDARTYCVIRRFMLKEIEYLSGIFHLENLYFFNDTATTEIYPLSLHDALPI